LEITSIKKATAFLDSPCCLLLCGSDGLFHGIALLGDIMQWNRYSIHWQNRLSHFYKPHIFEHFPKVLPMNLHTCSKKFNEHLTSPQTGQFDEG